MRRWTLLLAGAALWLFLAAVPALADGGPHNKVANNGTGAGGLTADSCAGCHRAHTGNGADLLVETDETVLCLSCHGSGGTGATTNVVNGVQFVPSTTNAWNRTGTILGALRDGGFGSAAIGSSNAYKSIGAATSYGFASTAKVPVLKDTNGAIAGAPVTSAHMAIPGGTLTSFTGTTWGNLTKTPSDTSVGATGGSLECGACHNPHGNGNYRILQTQPVVAGSADFQAAAAPGVAVTDAALPPSGDTRNYTVIQTAGGTGTLLASQAGAAGSNVSGDYLRRTVPWSGGTGAANDAPNGLPSTFNAQINAWCVTCHTRYLSGGGEDATNANAIFHNRHYSANSTRTPVCTTCHVGHGSNALMTAGGYSAGVNYPGQPVGTAGNPGDSRLLKVDNRGVCQTCHDPTHSLGTGDSAGTLPSPLTP